jgi:hypothetical protein
MSAPRSGGAYRTDLEDQAMPRTSPRQRKTTGRVMHEFAHGELRSGPGGRGGKVKSRRQAIAIALKEAGASKYESERENKRNLARTKRKEARGQTYQQERRPLACRCARPAREQPRDGWCECAAQDRARPQGGAHPRAQGRRRDQAAALRPRQGAPHSRSLQDDQAPT